MTESQAGNAKKIKNATLVALISRGVQAVIGVVALRLTTHFLSPSEIGQLSLLVAFISWFAMVLTNPVGQYVFRHTVEWANSNYIAKGFSAFVLYLLGAALIAAVGAIIYGYATDSRQWLEAASVVAFMILAQSYANTVSASLNLLERRMSASVVLNIAGIVGLVASVYLSQFHEPTSQNWVWGQAAGFAAASIFGWWALKKVNSGSPVVSAPFRLSPQEVKAYAIPLALATLPMWIVNDGFRFILEKETTLEFVGFIAIGLLIANRIGTIIEQLAIQIYSPYFFGRIATENDIAKWQPFWNEFYAPVASLYLLTALFVCFGAPVIAGLLAGPEYVQHWPFVAFGAGIQFFRSHGNLLSTIAHAVKKTSLLSAPYWVGAVVTILLTYIGTLMAPIKFWIPVGLLIASLVTNFAISRAVSGALRTVAPGRIFVRIFAFAPLFALPSMLHFNDRLQALTEHLNLYLIAILGTSFALAIGWIYKRTQSKVEFSTEVSNEI